jgi:hypothetical protein
VKEKPPTPKELYHLLNSRYFGGRLPKDLRVGFDKRSFAGGRARMILGSTWSDHETGRPIRISLNPLYRKQSRIWIGTLIHEMVHVQQWKVPEEQAHGRKFQKRMKQLAALGAFNGLW